MRSVASSQAMDSMVSDLLEAISFRDESKATQIVHSAGGQRCLSSMLMEKAILNNMEHTATEMLKLSILHKNHFLNADLLRLSCRRAMSDFIRNVPDLHAWTEQIRIKHEESLLQVTLSICNQRLEGTTTVSPRTRRRHETMIQGKVRQIIRHLVNQGANTGDQMTDGSGRTALHLMCSSPQDLNTVRFLLRHEADANIRDCTGRTPLVTALQINGAKSQDEGSMHLLQIVEELLNANADVNIAWETVFGQLHWPLHLAIGHSTLITQMILDHGANVNAVDESGLPALFYAMYTAPGNRMTILDALLSRKELQMDIHPDSGHTVLHYAAKLNEGAEQVTRKILDARPDATRFLVCTSKEGSLPLHDALRAGHTETALLLLQHGSPSHIMTHQHGGHHMTCLQMACACRGRCGHRVALVAELLARGSLSKHGHCATCSSSIDQHLRPSFGFLVDNAVYSTEDLRVLQFLFNQDIHLHMDWNERTTVFREIKCNEQVHPKLSIDVCLPTLKQLCRVSIRTTLAEEALQRSLDLNSAGSLLPLPHLLQNYLSVAHETNQQSC